jgi:hypothetical protein
MAPRLQLHQLLETVADNVYFQPPVNIQMQYPCIVYKRDFSNNQFADDKLYAFEYRYMLTVIDRDPDSEILEKVRALPKCVFNRFFTADNLNHDVFSIYF